MAQTSFVANVAAFRVLLDGTDLTARFAPKLISLTLTEKRGDEADGIGRPTIGMPIRSITSRWMHV